MYQGLLCACWRPGSVSGAHTQLPSVIETSQKAVSTWETWNPTCPGWKGTNLRWVGEIQGQKFPRWRAAAIEATCCRFRTAAHLEWWFWLESCLEFGKKEKKVNSTGCSQVVSHPGTIPAQCCLTLVFRWELVHSEWYGHWQGQNSGMETHVCKCTGSKTATAILEETTSAMTQRGDTWWADPEDRHLVGWQGFISSIFQVWR